MKTTSLTERITEYASRIHFAASSLWYRSARRWLASLGVLFLLASFTFVLFSFLAFQVQTWLVG